MAVARSHRNNEDRDSLPPIKRFVSRKMTKKEKIFKREVDAYHVSDVDNTAVLYVGNRVMQIYQSLDLPDAEVDGLVFKRRVVQTTNGACLLLARWKPDKHLRRTTTEWSQKWFVEKQLFPADANRFFAKLAEQARQAAESAPHAEEGELPGDQAA